ncbi:MAG: hypothetical protein JSU63_13595 [Phycisphaerales bacterium]|nr:MAG: hypothetical protein JSU63_13595 [Phycisphaerales bacterium]
MVVKDVIERYAVERVARTREGFGHRHDPYSPLSGEEGTTPITSAMSVVKVGSLTRNPQRPDSKARRSKGNDYRFSNHGDIPSVRELTFATVTFYMDSACWDALGLASVAGPIPQDR